MRALRTASGVQLLPDPEFDYLPLKGGLDQESTLWEVKPGRLRAAQGLGQIAQTIEIMHCAEIIHMRQERLDAL